MSPMSADSLALCRSYLFVPGDRPERFGKAIAAGADAVIIDLEDAVPIAAKDSAREAIAQWLARSPGAAVHVRINAVASLWFDADLALAAHPGVVAVMLPKAERAEDIAHVNAVTGKPVLALIESAQGVWNALAVARARHVVRLAFGSIDLQLDLDISHDDMELHYHRSQLVLASRVAGVAPPVDGVTPGFDDLAPLTRDAERARRMGFGAKLCIHPKQVDAVNRAFSPGEAELSWARRVVQAAAQSGGAAVALDGKMIDRPVIAQAERLIDLAARKP